MKKLRRLLALVAALGGVWRALKPEQREQVKDQARKIQAKAKKQAAGAAKQTAERVQAAEEVVTDEAGNPIQPQPEKKPD